MVAHGRRARRMARAASWPDRRSPLFCRCQSDRTTASGGRRSSSRACDGRALAAPAAGSLAEPVLSNRCVACRPTGAGNAGPAVAVAKSLAATSKETEAHADHRFGPGGSLENLVGGAPFYGGHRTHSQRVLGAGLWKDTTSCIGPKPSDIAQPPENFRELAS